METYTEMGNRNGRHMGCHALLANICSRSRRWDEAKDVRKDIEIGDGRNVPGSSSIEPGSMFQDDGSKSKLPQPRRMPGYYDMDDIIMEDEPTAVVFQVGAHGVGLLDPGSVTNSVEKGAKVELPFWLAHELHLRQAVSINVPVCFSQKTRKEIQADAACVDLRIRCLYFYELGRKIVPLVGDKTIGSFLLYAFTSRYKEILSKSHSASVFTVPKFLSRLTKEETQLFEASRSSMIAFKKWRTGGSRLEKASILGRKRKTTIPIIPSSP